MSPPPTLLTHRAPVILASLLFLDAVELVPVWERALASSRNVLFLEILTNHAPSSIGLFSNVTTVFSDYLLKYFHHSVSFSCSVLSTKLTAFFFYMFINVFFVFCLPHLSLNSEKISIWSRLFTAPFSVPSIEPGMEQLFRNEFCCYLWMSLSLLLSEYSSSVLSFSHHLLNGKWRYKTKTGIIINI